MIRNLHRLASPILVLASIVAARALSELPPPAPDTGRPVQWEGWRFRWSVRPREGLILTDVSFRGRQVLKYAGLAEIFVPYDRGQPRPEDSYQGMGATLLELRPGADCLPGTTCQMFDAGGRRAGKPVVGMHEESTGLIYLGRNGRAYGKLLVLWCASRLGRYTYLTRWRFRDDGRLLPQMGLTGELEHTGPRGDPVHGAVVERDPQGNTVFAPAHVHNFYFRLDFDIDGPASDAVEEFNHRQDQPHLSLSARDGWTLLPRETARSLMPGQFRSWRVVDQMSRNALGHRRSYEIVPGGNGSFRGGAREAFAQAEFWVTRFHAREFPFSTVDPRPLRQALPNYANGEAADGHDLVVWYVMAGHHHPRAEDWPAMPIEWAEFEIVPRDFLDASPLQPAP